MKLKILLLNNGISQVDLASKLGVTQALISKWANGKCQPQLEVIPKLAEALNCTIEEILNCFINKNSPDIPEQKEVV